MVVTAQVFNAMPPWRSTLSTGNYGVGSAWSMLVKTISWAWNGSRGVKVCVLRANKFADNDTAKSQGAFQCHQDAECQGNTRSQMC